MLTFNLIGFCDCFVNFFSFDTQSKRAPLKVIKIAVTTICLLVWITLAITLVPSDNVNLRWSKILTHLKHKQQVNPCLTLVEYKITSRRWIRNYRYLKFSDNNFFYYFNICKWTVEFQQTVVSVQYQQLDSPNNVGTCFAIPLGRIVVLVKGLIWLWICHGEAIHWLL